MKRMPTTTTCQHTTYSNILLHYLLLVKITKELFQHGRFAPSMGHSVHREDALPQVRVNNSRQCHQSIKLLSTNILISSVDSLHNVQSQFIKLHQGTCSSSTSSHWGNCSKWQCHLVRTRHDTSNCISDTAANRHMEDHSTAQHKCNTV